MHKRIHEYARILHTHIYVLTRTHMAHVCTHTRKQTYLLTPTYCTHMYHTHKHACIYQHTCTHTRLQKSAHTRTHTNARAHTHTHANSHIHACTQTHLHTCVRKHVHVHTIQICIHRHTMST